ncbi:type II toxin-antitoxin system RelE/ParE family toxin [bacterium]|nr:MAG: type II toxin-antitoxin system RelE/ParE family toxin [bacterium]
MAQRPESRFPRIVRLAVEAEADLSAIYDYTAQLWGIIQADDYDEFLAGVMQQLAENPEIAPLAPNLKVRIYVARWKNARQGHRVFFIETTDGITVARILHTAMNWPEHFGIV